MIKNFFSAAVLFFLGAVGVSCSTADHPTYEYVMAREAFNSAKEVEAARFAPGYFHKAEESFRQGEKLYQEKSYAGAVEEFRQARRFAEKAENAARVIRQKTGDEGI